MSKLCQGFLFLWKSKVQKNRVKSGNRHALWRKQNSLSCAFLCTFVLCLGFCSFSCVQKRSVASLWGSCQVFVINHIFEYFWIFFMRKTLFNHLSQYTFLSHSEISLIIWKSIMVTKHQVKIVPRHLASLWPLWSGLSQHLSGLPALGPFPVDASTPLP